MKHIFKLSRSGSDVIDFQNPANSIFGGWKLAPYDEKAIRVQDELHLNPVGATLTTFYDNLTTFGRALTDGYDNFNQWQTGMPYSPIFLQFKTDGSATTLQSEWFGADPQEVENFMSGALRAKVIPDLIVKSSRRPYFEETAAQSIVASQAVSNNGGYYDVTGVRGDVPSPLTITVRTATTGIDRVFVACKARGTVTNFVNKYEAESYTTKLDGTIVDLTDANLSGGHGMQWTPGVTSEQTLLAWDIATNVADQLGTYRVLVRCRDNAATCNTRIRVRAGVYVTGSTPQYGDYGTIGKYTDGTGTAGGSGVDGTTAIPLIDCGVITLPPVDLQGGTPSKMTIELAGKATATGSSNKFDIDCIYLMPLYELPCQAGFVMATFPVNLGNGAAPDAILTAADRLPRAYLDSAGTIQYGSTEIRGTPLLGWNNKTIRTFVMTQNSGNLRHTQNLNNTLTISATPRYRFPGRGS